jgi:hypothetical protein
MALHSRQDLAEYCLRQLGAPVINIEIAEDQLADNIEDALEFFHEYHSDGVTRDYVKHKITFSTVTVTDATGILPGAIEVINDTEFRVRSVSGNVLSLYAISGDHRVNIGDSFFGSAVAGVSWGDIDNKWVPIDDDIMGVTRIFQWVPAVADGMFDIMYQLRMNDLRNLTSGTMNYYTSTMEYLATLDFLLRKEKQFRFNRRMGRLYIDDDMEKEVNENTYIIVECHRYLNADEFSNVFNDPWLKSYTTARMKKQWGSNLRKYNGVQLIGGVTLDGERIYAEAVMEIDKLENILVIDQAPLGFQVG